MRFGSLERHKVGGTDDRMLLSVPLPRTASGKLYQYSPNPEAAPRLFLIGNAPEERSIADEHRPRIRRNPGPGQIVCPYSGCTAPDDEFVHFDDKETVKTQVAWKAVSGGGDEHGRPRVRA